jgi:5-formyltetrahydrofolate cyclo-ligase
LFEKNEFRKKLISRIEMLSDSERVQKSNQILLRLQKLLKSFSGSWGAYQPLSSEPDIEFRKVLDIDWCYPKVVGHKLDFCSGSRQFQASSLKVMEPIDGTVVDINQLTGLCIPGLGFHSEGFRLGRGKGFYDKTFSDFLGTKIGICYDFCLSSDVPYELHDIKMDYIVTDLQVIHTGEN